MFWRAKKCVYRARFADQRRESLDDVGEFGRDDFDDDDDERRRKGGPLDGEERWAKFDDSVDGNNKLTQIVTLYREENGSFEPKAYNVKLQSVGNSTTLARGILDASQFCSEDIMQALSEGGYETKHEMRMENGVCLRCKVRMTWLKNATSKGGSRRGSEMDMTELSFISSTNLSGSFVAHENNNNNNTNQQYVYEADERWCFE